MYSHPGRSLSEPAKSTAQEMLHKDLVVAPMLEAGLLFAVCLAGLASHQPLIFASLGPTAYELVETPKRKSAQPYNILCGHFIAVVAGFTALLLTGAFAAPSISAHGVPLARVWACTIAAMLTVFGTLGLRAAQPAAVSTTLLIASGIMQTWRDGVVIMAAILLLTAIGEPLRRWRAKDSKAE
jgi:CBS-domain-containing membrane protein